MMGLSALNPPRAGAGALRGNAASRPALPASNLCAAAAPLLPVRPLLRRRHSTHRRPAVASNGNGAATLSPKAVLEETRDLRARFEALQAEVAAYRKLNDENALLAQEVERVVQVGHEGRHRRSRGANGVLWPVGYGHDAARAQAMQRLNVAAAGAHTKTVPLLGCCARQVGGGEEGAEH